MMHDFDPGAGVVTSPAVGVELQLMPPALGYGIGIWSEVMLAIVRVQSDIDRPCLIASRVPDACERYRTMIGPTIQFPHHALLP